jgi:membrane protein
MPASRNRSLMRIPHAVRAHFLTGIWSRPPAELRGWRSVAIRTERVLTAAVAEFFGDRCMLRASALTFYTLLSIVPVLAVVFGVAKGFGLERLLEKELMEQMAGQQAALERILTFARNMLDDTRGGLIAGVGVVVMFWSAFKVIGQIEAALNAMWGIRNTRSWVRRFSDYLTMMLLAPVLLLAAGGISVFIRTQVDAVVARFEIVGLLGPLVIRALGWMPLLIVWTLFMMIYLVLPNARVRWSAAAIGAAVAAVLYQLVQWVYVDLQVGVARQNAIYGSFAALPLFLAWVQASWIIILFGAEMCYAAQNSDDYCRPTGCPAPAPVEKIRVGLQIARTAAQRFSAGAPPLNARELAHTTGFPLPWVQQTADELVQAGVFSRTVADTLDDAAFQPAMDIMQLTLQRVVDALLSVGAEPNGLFPASGEAARLDEALKALRRAASESSANRLLKDV